MAEPTLTSDPCPIHGHAITRERCRSCNAAYMRAYLRRRRREHPDRELRNRARKRAYGLGLPFALPKEGPRIPVLCPVLGIELRVGGGRSDASPSLDRVVPAFGYVNGNVRVISDRANRLKSDYALDELRRLAEHGNPAFRAEYKLLVRYVERSLRKMRVRTAVGGSAREAWNELADDVERVLTRRGRL